MKYLSVEKRCELILELYQSLYGVLESPILRGRSVESNSMSNTLNRGIIFKTRSETNTTSEKTTKYDYEYKGKLAPFLRRCHHIWTRLMTLKQKVVNA